MSRIRLVQFVAAAAAALALAGCGGSPIEPTKLEKKEPTAEESTPPASSPSPSPSEATGTTDEEKGTTRETLDAAAKAEIAQTVSTYLDTLDEAYRTGKTDAVEKLAHDKCAFCAQLAGYIDDVYAKGGRIEGSQAGEPQDVEVGDELFVLAGTVRQARYSAKVSWSEGITYHKSGKVADREPASVEKVRFTLEQAGDQWKVRSWEVQ
ncbi:MAG TPA: DUF6318 family protein [Actinopolymorphaceae bacterium]